MALERSHSHIRHSLLIVIVARAESFNLSRQGEIHNRPINLQNSLLSIDLIYPLELYKIGMMQLIWGNLHVIIGTSLYVDNVGDASPLNLLFEAEHHAVPLCR